MYYVKYILASLNNEPFLSSDVPSNCLYHDHHQCLLLNGSVIVNLEGKAHAFPSEAQAIVIMRMIQIQCVEPVTFWHPRKADIKLPLDSSAGSVLQRQRVYSGIVKRLHLQERPRLSAFSEIDSLNEQILNARAEIQQLKEMKESAGQSLKKAGAELRQTILRKEDSIRSLKNKNAQLTKVNIELSNKLNARNIEVNKRSVPGGGKKVGELQSSITALEIKEAKLNESIASLSAKQTDLLNSNSTLATDFVGAEKTWKNLQSQLASAREQVDIKEGELRAIQAATARTLSELEELTKQLVVEQAHLKSLLLEEETSTQRTSELLADCHSLENHLQALSVQKTVAEQHSRKRSATLTCQLSLFKELVAEKAKDFQRQTLRMESVSTTNSLSPRRLPIERSRYF